MVKNLPGIQEMHPWIRKIPQRRKCQPTPVFLPGEFHGQRILAGYSPWGHKELDTTERLSLIQQVLSFTSWGNVQHHLTRSYRGTGERQNFICCSSHTEDRIIKQNNNNKIKQNKNQLIGFPQMPCLDVVFYFLW